MLNINSNIEGVVTKQVSSNQEMVDKFSELQDQLSNHLEDKISIVIDTIHNMNSIIGGVASKQVSNNQVMVGNFLNLDMMISNNLSDKLIDIGDTMFLMNSTLKDVIVKQDISNLEIMGKLSDLEDKQIDFFEDDFPDVNTTLNQMDVTLEAMVDKLDNINNITKQIEIKADGIENSASQKKIIQEDIRIKVASIEDKVIGAMNSKLDLLLNSVRCAGDGGVQIGNQCLYFNEEKLSWYDAKTACHAKQAQLALLKNQPDAVSKYAHANYGGGFWVGGSDAANEGSWKWLDGTPFDDQFPWTSGEPNNIGNEDCIVADNYGFYDRNCTDKIRYICEQVAPKCNL
ncbi:unnamed protein product [Meganyctiphanes norvegica]|uniref:C-type lectin domain-containing protein n=1 Tax=Meganyctiphanes norvegica TaxID=48144 RepID=A0AAV2RN60_MEGNR